MTQSLESYHLSSSRPPTPHKIHNPLSAYLKGECLSIWPPNEPNLIFIDSKGGGKEEGEGVYPTRQAPNRLTLVIKNQLNTKGKDVQGQSHNGHSLLHTS